LRIRRKKLLYLTLSFVVVPLAGIGILLAYGNRKEQSSRMFIAELVAAVAEERSVDEVLKHSTVDFQSTLNSGDVARLDQFLEGLEGPCAPLVGYGTSKVSAILGRGWEVSAHYSASVTCAREELVLEFDLIESTALWKANRMRIDLAKG